MTTTEPPPPIPADWQPPPPPPSSRPPTKLLAGVAAAIVAVAVLAGFLLTRGPGDFRLHGAVAVTGTESFYAIGGDNKCAGAHGYDDLAAGAGVVVSDSSGKTIAVGSVTDTAAAGTVCMLTFDIPKVPAAKKFYGIQVTHRGVVQFSEQQMKSGPVLTIGSN